MYFGQSIDPAILQPFARRFDEIILRTFLKILDIEHISDQKLQIQLAVSKGGCGIRTHDLKELQRLYVSSALLVAPAVFAATGERIDADAVGAEEVDAWPRTTRGYEADVGLYNIPGERDLYLDGVISLANPQHTTTNMYYLH